MPWCSKWFYPSGFQPKPVYITFLHHPCHMPCPHHCPWTNLWRWELSKVMRSVMLRKPNIHCSCWPRTCKVLNGHLNPRVLQGTLDTEFWLQRVNHPNNNWSTAQIMKLLIMQFSPVFRHFLPLRPKYIPRHPILQHPLPMFSPYCDRTSSMLIYTYIKLLLRWFWQLSPSLRCCVTFLYILLSYCEELLALHPTPKLDEHPLLAVCNYLFIILAATLKIDGPSPTSATRGCTVPRWEAPNNVFSLYTVKHDIIKEHSPTS